MRDPSLSAEKGDDRFYLQTKKVCPFLCKHAQAHLTCVRCPRVTHHFPCMFCMFCISLYSDLSCSSSISCSPWFQGKSFPIRVKWPPPKRGPAWWWVVAAGTAADARCWKETLGWLLPNVCFLQMMALCFILVLGSFSSCISPLSPLTETSPLSSSSHPSSPKPLPSADLYSTQGSSMTILLLPLVISI